MHFEDADTTNLTEHKERPLQFPMSPDGMSLLIDKFDFKTKAIIRVQINRSDQIKEFFSGMKNFIQLAVRKLALMLDVQKGTIDINNDDLKDIEHLITKFDA